MKKTTILATACLIFLGCHKHSDDPPPPPAVANANGTWNGSASDSRGVAPTSTFTLSQSNTSVTGTYSTSATSGSVSAIVTSATSMSFTLSQIAPCSGQLTGTASINGNVMSISYSGLSGCTDTNAVKNGTGSFSRQAVSPSISLVF